MSGDTPKGIKNGIKDAVLKPESVTNQANYLMMVLTTAMIGIITAIINEPSKIPMLASLFVLWTGAFFARTIKSYIEALINKMRVQTQTLEKEMDLKFELDMREIELKYANKKQVDPPPSL